MKIKEPTLIEPGNIAAAIPRSEKRNSIAEKIEGIIPPLITPLDNGRLDVPGLERLINHTVAGGVNGLFILGTTGEGPSLSYQLKRELISATCRIANQQVPVLVGITDTCLAEAMALANHAADAGADAVVTSTPYYFPASQPELIQYIRQLASELPLPLLLYNMPQLTKVWFEPETVRELLEIEIIAGLKDSSGNLEYFRKLTEIARPRPDWCLFIGEECSLVAGLQMGASGGVTGGAQIDPQLFAALYATAKAGENGRAAELQQRLLQLGSLYTIGSNASGVIKGLKCALSLMGFCRDELAPPFAPFAANEREKARVILEELNLLPTVAR